MDRQCLPKNKVRLLTSEDIALRRQQVRLKLAQLAQQQEEESTNIRETEINLVEEKEVGDVFVAFARVFSGTLRKGQELYVLGPKYDPNKTNTIAEVVVDPGLTLKVKLLSFVQLHIIMKTAF